MPVPSGHDDAVSVTPGVENRSILEADQPEPGQQIAYGPHADQVADIYRPPASAPDGGLVLFVHGGYWRPPVDRRHARSIARALAGAGYVTCSIEYRRVPGEPSLTITDVCLALGALPALLGLADEVPLLVGHSAGGHLALIAASQNPHLAAGVLALAPVADLQSAEALDLGSGAVPAFLGGPAGARPDLDPVRCDSPGLPTTVIHGARDSIVPIAQAHALALAWPGTCRVVVVDDAAHFELIDPGSTAWQVVADEVGRLLAQADRR
ncbi:MAG: alpha/beta hydrolase [Candidatus Nanopelagicales bacterium]